MPKTQPTIRDVAAAAGVAVSTVSKYINGTQRFSGSVEAKLKAAIDALGYRSNPLARSMITGKTRTIGLAILDIRNPHFTNIVKGANRVALQHDYTLLLVDTEESQERERPLIEALAQRVDGMIISSRMPDDAVQWLLELSKPVVLFGRSQQFPIASVGTDGHLAASMLARHLLNLGHRRIAYLGFAKSRWNDERRRGIVDCLQKAGLQLDVHDAEAPSAIAGERACSAILLGSSQPDAVICYNDLIALGFMKEARELGFRLPQDLSVVGFDNVSYAEYASPALTTVDLQSEKMGELAMTKLIAALNGSHDDAYAMLEPRLVVRESTMRRPDTSQPADVTEMTPKTAGGRRRTGGQGA
ncbi:LacI family DNA-binding transcriptional regulator [Paraburkholderia oxyphila]|uniref:LacI family DNA-binding transcriptional regulator n=1 Tax=Paraburkholderia oxyphila TaxID=614212 RepID=UPI000A0592E5|nr:LacI family DNA-binding transcriptional regulator [Paraburkholderia oxyphila]